METPTSSPHLENNAQEAEQAAMKRHSQILADTRQYEAMSLSTGSPGAAIKGEALAKVKRDLSPEEHLDMKMVTTDCAQNKKWRWVERVVFYVAATIEIFAPFGLLLDLVCEVFGGYFISCGVCYCALFERVCWPDLTQELSDKTRKLGEKQ